VEKRKRSSYNRQDRKREEDTREKKREKDRKAMRKDKDSQQQSPCSQAGA
jgi:hypothetical protein